MISLAKVRGADGEGHPQAVPLVGNEFDPRTRTGESRINLVEYFRTSC